MLKRPKMNESQIDEELGQTFPASDSPSWTLGLDQDKSSMKAMLVRGYGGPEQLHYESVPLPEIGWGEVLVRVVASSINPIDCKLAAGAVRPVLNNKAVGLPWIPGCDFAGTVEKTGLGISGLKKGDAVYGNCPLGGAYAEFVIAQAEAIALKPKKLSFVQASGVPLAGQTAWQALFDHGRLERGQTVLIHGGSGGVGSFAVQLAHWKRAEVIATGSASHIDYLKELGADRVIDYQSTVFETVVKEVDVVIDLIGGETQERSFGVLKKGGYLVSTISPPSPAQASQCKVHAVMMTMRPFREQLKRLAELIDGGLVKAHVTKTYLLSEAQHAWEDILSHHTQGKLVLQIS